MRRMNAVNRQKALEVVKNVDAFQKIPDSFKETSASGGGASLVAFLIIAILVYTEFLYYNESHLEYEYEVDRDHSSLLKINIDITVAMHCSAVGADVLDMTGQGVQVHGALQEEDTHFTMSTTQKNYYDAARMATNYLRDQYHAVHKLIWRSNYLKLMDYMPPRDDEVTTPPDACRFHGTLEVNKVAGNFHVTAGKTLPIMGKTHIHLSFSGNQEYNFSHRINSMSFGDQVLSMVNPLDSEEKISHSHSDMFQYFLQVVPTHVQLRRVTVDTYQFAVTEQNRTINHHAGSHGVPGIFFKYDMSSLKVSVREYHRPYWKFLVRLCGIIGGVFATSGVLHNLIDFGVDCACRKYKWGQYKHLPLDKPSVDTTEPATSYPGDSPFSQSAVDTSPVSLLSS